MVRKRWSVSGGRAELEIDSEEHGAGSEQAFRDISEGC